jgi:rod shape-determining protein MreC
MRRIAYKPYVFFFLFLFCILSLPHKATERMRAMVVASLAPSWEGIRFIQDGSKRLFAALPAGFKIPGNQVNEEMERLSQENQRLHAQIDSIREWLQSEEKWRVQLDRIKSLAPEKEVDPAWKEFLKRRTKALSRSLTSQLQSVYAKVIFREPSSWNSSLWLNVGQRDNERLGAVVIAKNSPVLLGTSVVGVIEYVGAKQSRVRLISDSGLIPSVRATRGSEQNLFLLEHLEALVQNLSHRSDLFSSSQEADAFLQALSNFKKRLSVTNKDYYLAKGELRGSSAAHFRTKSQILTGRGFNYDFPDEEGPARDLRLGNILQVGDLLVTTGMDGIFPAGLKVAVVTKVGRLRGSMRL